MSKWIYLIFLFFSVLSLSNPALLIEIALEGLTTPKYTNITDKQFIQRAKYNDTLSSLGRKEQFLLGLEIRSRYNDTVFSGECNPLNIYAYSVSKQSTMLSGQMQLAGINL